MILSMRNGFLIWHSFIIVCPTIHAFKNLVLSVWCIGFLVLSFLVKISTMGGNKNIIEPIIFHKWKENYII